VVGVLGQVVRFSLSLSLSLFDTLIVVSSW